MGGIGWRVSSTFTIINYGDSHPSKLLVFGSDGEQLLELWITREEAASVRNILNNIASAHST